MRAKPRRKIHTSIRLPLNLIEDLEAHIHDQHHNPGSEYENFNQVVEAMLSRGLESTNKEGEYALDLKAMTKRQLIEILKKQPKSVRMDILDAVLDG